MLKISLERFWPLVAPGEFQVFNEMAPNSVFTLHCGPYKKNRDEFLCPGYCVVSVVTTHSQIQNFSFLLLILNQVESGVAIFSEKIMHH